MNKECNCNPALIVKTLEEIRDVLKDIYAYMGVRDYREKKVTINEMRKSQGLEALPKNGEQ